MIGLNSNIPIDMTLFNKLVIKGGGDPVITKKQIISMRNFITILLKLFRKDYISRNKKHGGYDDSSTRDLGIFNVALKYGDLNYSNSYEPPKMQMTERSYT
jgi:hypothetical protein